MGALLPLMPPRSRVFRKRMQRKFISQRATAFRQLLAALLLLDPQLSCPELRDFLGLKMQTCSSEYERFLDSCCASHRSSLATTCSLGSSHRSMVSSCE